METPRSDAATDFFVESLGRLTDKTGPLHTALRQVREALKSQRIQLSDDIDDRLRQVERDLSAVQVGSKRVVKQVDQLQALVYTSALITSSLDAERVLEEVMDTAIALTNAERAYLVLRKEEGEELELRAARNWDREALPESDVTFSRGVIERALETGEPVLTDNAQGDQRFENMQSVLLHDLRSILCIPLSLRGRTIGVLYADNRIAQGVFDKGSVQLLTAFANQAAIAIENARTFTRVKADLAEAQLEVSRLQIEINEQRLHKDVSDITETEYFQWLAGKARDMRKRLDPKG